MERKKIMAVERIAENGFSIGGGPQLDGKSVQKCKNFMDASMAGATSDEERLIRLVGSEAAYRMYGIMPSSIPRRDQKLNQAHGQYVPEDVGMGYRQPSQHNNDIPVGAGEHYRPMPLPSVKDPESSLTDQEIMQKQVGPGHPDDPATLEHIKETRDPTGITYGTAAKPYAVKTYPPKYGLQRSPPSSYNDDDDVTYSGD